jgi:glutathione S-transferase
LKICDVSKPLSRAFGWGLSGRRLAAEGTCTFGPMKLTLFYAPVSCALVPYVALAEAGADFDVEAIDNNRQQNVSPPFLAVNPKGKVPVLLIDGQALTENVAIQIWVARNFPDARLLPEGWDEIQAISLLAWFASGVHPHLTPHNRPRRYCDTPGSEESVKRLAGELLMQDFRICENRLAGREWFFAHFTTVDIYFFWCFRRALLFGLDLSPFPACHAHFERMSLRPAVQRVLAFETQVEASFRMKKET